MLPPTMANGIRIAHTEPATARSVRPSTLVNIISPTKQAEDAATATSNFAGSNTRTPNTSLPNNSKNPEIRMHARKHAKPLPARIWPRVTGDTRSRR